MDFMLKWRLTLLRLFTVVLTLSGLILLGGCEASEEATEDEYDDGQMMEEPAEEEESGDQQALTSFIGAAPKATTAPATVPEPKKEEPVMPARQPAVDYQAQVEELRTENTSLKQKIVKLEQDNRSLTARLSDTEVKLMAEKERADKALETAKTTMVTTRGAAVTAPAPTTTMAKPASGAYDSGLQMFKSKNYDGVISTMQGLLSGGAAENIQDNCHYWTGEAYFAKRQYAEAIQHFQKVFDYAKSEKKADAQFMIAQSYDRMGNKAKAKSEYEKLVKDYPTSGKIQRAKDRWARL